MIKNFGFIKMNVEENEKRDFTPNFFESIYESHINYLLEESYGEKLGYTPQEYIKKNNKVTFLSREEILKQSDLITVIRTPDNIELEKMKNGSAIFSMLHYVTHAKRIELLLSKKIKMYAMDSIVDDFGIRMIQDIKGTSINAVNATIKYIQQKNKKEVLKVVIMGSGEVGKQAADAFASLQSLPVIASVVGPSVTRRLDLLHNILVDCDILVDATYRKDTSQHIIKNELIGILPKDAVILDISADDYDTSIYPIQVKAIEGIPTGNLDKYIFEDDDNIYNNLPKSVSTKNRRSTISCYSWPAVDPIRCLNIYEKQLTPFIKILNNYDEVNADSNDFYIRALARGKYNNSVKKRVFNFK